MARLDVSTSPQKSSNGDLARFGAPKGDAPVTHGDVALDKAMAMARDRTGRWLAAASYQVRAGAQAGAIAGALDAAGHPRFLYGEITGYWLRWAAQYHPDPDRIGAAVAWLDRQWSASRPPSTRPGARGDWRNQALFSFDLAMVLQGLADVAPLLGGSTALTIGRRIGLCLEAMVGADGLLEACIVRDPEGFPVRWSTQRGPYQAKSAVAILSVPAGWTPSVVIEAAHRTLAYWLGTTGASGPWHPRLYAAEGNLRAGAINPALALLRELPTSGVITEPPGDDEPAPRVALRRADVLAQALRLRLLVSPETPALRRDAALSLLSHVRADGALGFSDEDSGANIWCALFAHQALDWWCAGSPDGRGRTPRADDMI